MKVWRKFTAVALALVMMLAMSAVALAEPLTATMENQSGVIGEFNPAATGDDDVKAPQEYANKVTIYKELKVFNPSATSINAPTVSFRYTIAGDSSYAGKTITDARNVSITTYAGPDGATFTAETVSWDTTGTVTADTVANNGSPNRKAIEVDLSGVNFERAGVYRYRITESIVTADGQTSDQAYAAAGLADGNDHTRYLDVYVKDDEGTADQIYGYVLSKANENIPNVAGDPAVDQTVKTEAFTGDEYHTFNLKITKTVTNDAFTVTAKTKFNFAVVFTNATVTNAVLPIVTATDSSTASVTAPSTGAAMSSFDSTAPQIASGGEVTYTGLPFGTAVSVTETNPLSTTTYGVTTTGGDTNLADAMLVGSGTSGAFGFNAYSTDADKTLAVTNDMKIISPTGVALRYAPYFAMLGAGIVALPLSIRRRKEDF